ncbi:MAG TPA: hypothetical protein VE398_03270, partial [Acidobacteriota bacterium]|nr:hypothetical protein [Acidobacteriota bacterium]
MKFFSVYPGRLDSGKSALLWALCLSLAFITLPAKVSVAQEDSALKHISLPLSPIEQAEKDGTAVRLSLKDITKLALQNNLDIAISDTNEELYQQKVLQAYGPYDPAISVNL